MRTQVGIVGAGPAGLLLSHLLHLEGIESVVLEVKSLGYILGRVRAGVLEQSTVDLLTKAGLTEPMNAEGMVHDGIELRFDGRSIRIDFKKLTGCSVMVYGQQQVVRDLVNARQAANGQVLFEVEDVSVNNPEQSSPSIQFTKDGERVELECDFIAGCDGFHGVCRPSIPAGVLHTFERVYPFGWLGILAETPPSSEELIYANHERGFALHSMRSPILSRNYIQCAPDEDLANWSDDRVWDELHKRLEIGDGWSLSEGKVIEKSVTPMRSFVTEPLRYHNLFLAGDSAHIVPPTGAKGLNLAASDVGFLAEAFIGWYQTDNAELLDNYSRKCLRRIWRAEHFSWWMTSLMHRYENDDDFGRRLQLSQLNYISSSEIAAKSLAENYVGIA